MKCSEFTDKTVLIQTIVENVNCPLKDEISFSIPVSFTELAYIKKMYWELFTSF